MQIRIQRIHRKISGLVALVLVISTTGGYGAISPDSAFDGDGIAITKVGAGRDEALAIAVQDDGKIVVAGRSGEPGMSEMTVVRYLPDGSVDQDFSFNGGAQVGVGYGDDEVRSLKIDNDGNILLGGYATEYGTRVGTLVRLQNDGQFDFRFGDAGIVLFGGGASEFSDIEIGDDGKIIAAGTAGSDADASPLFVRFEPNGAIDQNFAEGGTWSPTDLGGDLHSLALESGGTIIGGGSAIGDEGKRQLLLIRLTADGSPVDSFGDQGRLTVPDMDEDVSVYDVELLPDSSLVAVGEIVDKDGTSSIIIGHYSADGSPDISLSENGMQRYDIGERSSAYAVSVLTGGDIFVTGYRQNESGKDTVILAFELTPVNIFASDLNDIDEQAESEDELRQLLLLSELQLENDVLDGSLPADVEEKGLEADLTTTELKDSDEESQAIETLSDGTVFTAGSSGSMTDSGILVAKYLADETTGTDGIGELYHTTSSQFYRVQTLPVTDITRVSAETGGIITQLQFDTEACRLRCDEMCSDEDAAIDDPVTDDPTTDDPAADDSTGDEDGANGALADSADEEPVVSSSSSSCSAQCVEECSVPTVVKRGVVYSVDIDPMYDPDGSEDPPGTVTDINGAPDGSGTGGSSDGSSGDSTDDSSITNPLGQDSLLNLDDYFVTEGQTDDDAGTGEYVSDIEEINPQTIYYVRAYALLSDGTVVYGNQFEFRTEDSCFIATAAFGSIDGSAVRVLRQFRDRYLNSWAGGQAFVALYYHLSPSLADVVAESLALRLAVIFMLLPVALWAWTLLHLEAVVLALVLAAMYHRYRGPMRLKREML